jgi:hypothetical protein
MDVSVDVGGQRNSRKKWIHCFENVGVISFAFFLPINFSKLHLLRKTHVQLWVV